MRPAESFVAQPVRSLQTMLRVLSMDDSRSPSVIPDGIYGPDTMNAVSSFQRRNGLASTGVTDQQTWDRIVDAYEQALIRIGKAQYIEILIDPGEVFREGDSDPYIYLAQAMLSHLSENEDWNASEVTGTFDPLTKENLLYFQKLSGLDETGELDRITWKHLVHHFTLSAHRARSNGSRNIF